LIAIKHLPDQGQLFSSRNVTRSKAVVPMPVLTWLLRPLLLLAAVIAGWFVAEDAANFGIIQMVIAVLLIAALVAFAAFWEAMLDWWREGGK
jgi:hypothetical protein